MHVLALVGVCALTFFAGLGAPAIADSDEAFYAESAREMVETGDWLTPHFNYTYRFEKPVLYYWFAAVSFSVVGVTEAAARFPSALAGLGLVFLSYAIGRRWYDPATGLLAGLVTATSFGYVAMARQALPDLTLAFFITLTIASALVALVEFPTPPAATRSKRSGRRVALLVAAIGAAGGLLTKGPIGLVLPALVVTPWVARDLYQVGWARRRLGWSECGLVVVVLVGLAAPWYVEMASVHGTAYLERFFLTENVERFATARYNAPRPVWYYVPIVGAGLLPWAPLLALWVPRARLLLGQIRRRTLGVCPGVVCLWWAVAPLLFFTLSIGKQPRYILPVLPPLAVLVARGLRQYLASDRQANGWFVGATVFSGVTLCVFAALVYRAAPLLVQWDVAWVSGMAVAVALSGLAVVGTARYAQWSPAALVAASVVASVSFHTVALSSPRLEPVERMAQILADHRTDDEPYGRYGVLNRNLVFYTRAPFQELPSEQAVFDFLNSAERVLTVLPVEEVSKLEARGLTLFRLGEVQYLNVGSLTLRVLVDPDPDRYLRRIVLVSNRQRSLAENHHRRRDGV